MSPAEQAALKSALRLPWPSFPCNEGKRPTCPNGFYDACRGVELEKLWSCHPGELVGVPTGEASGFDVLDVDLTKGGEGWWSANKARLPPTRLQETRSGGLHVLFNLRAGLKCSAGKIAPGIDVRAEGGYVIWWPAAGFSVVDHPLAEWPEWLRPPEPEPVRFSPLPPTGSVNNSRYGATALDWACAAIGGAANGDQESTLNRESYSIGQLVSTGVINQVSALNRLMAAASAMPSYDSRRPWTSREVASKVNRAFGQGLQRPRNPVRRVG
jgi:hypothetical protein